MSDRNVIQDRLKKKEQEVHALEEKLRSARIYVQALHDVLKVLGPVISSGGGETEPKPGSMTAQARDIIMKADAPVHVSELLRQMGRSEDAKASLTGSLAAYVRREEIFTRPAPNTYGLIELGHSELLRPVEDQPPKGFGVSFDDDEDVPF